MLPCWEGALGIGHPVLQLLLPAQAKEELELFSAGTHEVNLEILGSSTSQVPC